MAHSLSHWRVDERQWIEMKVNTKTKTKRMEILNRQVFAWHHQKGRIAHRSSKAALLRHFPWKTTKKLVCHRQVHRTLWKSPDKALNPEGSLTMRFPRENLDSPQYGHQSSLHGQFLAVIWSHNNSLWKVPGQEGNLRPVQLSVVVPPSRGLVASCLVINLRLWPTTSRLWSLYLKSLFISLSC